MKTNLRTDITVAQICEGFTYNTLEGKGLFGLSGRLTIQPEYQRNFIYEKENKEKAVIESVLKGYPLGIIYFNKVGDDRFEVLDGQQRITSLGRFLTGKFHIIDDNGMQQYFEGLAEDKKEKIRQTHLLIYECEGGESEIKAWFKTINIVGIALNDQELNNATYSGPFVTRLRGEFSNPNDARISKWSAYIQGSAHRQDYLRCALDWVSHGNIETYMSLHRMQDNISEVTNYFNSVIDWIDSVFTDVESEMRGLQWGRLYEKYHTQPYDANKVHEKVMELYSDPYVKDRKGVFEYILGGCKETRLINIRVFDDATKHIVYQQQTKKAEEEGSSNCPYCAIGHNNNRTKIWRLAEMDADHVTAWSKGGATDISNCQMLCKTHNRAKGNR